MDEETRRHIRDAEWTRMRAREVRASVDAQRDAEEQRAHQKRVNYVNKFGREAAVTRTILKWTVGCFILSCISFNEMWQEEGFLHAISMLGSATLVGAGIGLYRASRLPHEQ